MRIVAVLSVAFVVLVGVVAVTYPNESDEVRQRNAAFMKLGDIKGESVKADPEQRTASALNNPTTCTRTVTDTTAKNKAATELKRDPIFRATLACVCQDLNQISRIVEKLDAKNPVAADLRAALERTKNSLKDVQVTSYGFHDDNDDGYFDKASPNVNGFQESSGGANDDELCS